MEQKNLSIWLRVIAAFMGIVGLLVFFLAIPQIIDDCRATYPQYEGIAAAAKVLCYVAALPFVAAVAQFYLICCRIGRDQSFSRENAAALRFIGYMAIADTGLVFVVFLTLMIAGAFNAGAAIASVMVMLLGVLVATAAFALSHLVMKAYNLKQDNDLTV